MGRAPKHHTLEEKRVAQQAAKRKYSASNKGKHAKSGQNARAYQRRTAKNEAQQDCPTLDDDPLHVPAHLICLAQQPLRNSRLFQEALQSAEALDESDLAVWDARPPYNTLPAHQENDVEHRFTEKIVQVMAGKRLRELREAGEKRMRCFETDGPLVVVCELEEEIKRLLVLCREDTPAASPAALPGSSRDLRMAHFHQEWSARRLLCLDGDLQLLRKNAREYRRRYFDDTLVWQTIPVAMN